MSETYPVDILPLDHHHDRGEFCCGVKFIDNFLAKRCLDAHDRYKVRAYVAVPPGSPTVVGFYTLSLTALKPDDTSPEEAQEKFGTWAIPLVYLGQIGVHGPLQKGKRIGSALMFHAFATTLEIAERAGTYGLALDAIDEERALWYEGLNFQRYGVEADGRIKMVCPLGTVREAIAMINEE